MTVNIVTPDNLERFAEGSKEKFARASHTHSNATTSKAGFMSAEDKQTLTSLASSPKDGIYYVSSPTGTVGTKGVTRSIWAGTISNINALHSGLTISYKVPVAGVSDGVTLNINNLGEHPVLLNADTLVTTHYPVGTILVLVYDAEDTATVTINDTATSFTGCWKLSNWDTNTKYSAMSEAEALAGTATTARSITAKVLDAKIANELASLVDNAPETLNTLSELSTALGNDPNFATTVANNIGNKLDSDSANYIKDLSISGKTITFTRGDDTTDTLVTQDTNTDTKVTSVGNHYTPSANADSALTNDVSSTGAYALNTEYNVITGITLSRDAKGHVVGISTTNQKVKDTNTTYSAGTTAQLTTGTDTANRVWPAKQIADYVKGKADKAITTITRSGTTFTYTCVDGTTGTFTQQDNNTTYSNFVKSGSGAAAGLVPAPSTTAGTTKYLREDGTWQVPPDTNTTYSSKTAASGGTDVSLVTTGEKYTWNNKSSLALGTTSTTAAKGDHTHTTTLATDSGTATVTLAHNTVYKLTAGGTSVIFKTPADNNTTYSSKTAASGGTDVSLVTTGEKYTWNNKSNLTIGTTATTAAAGNHTHSYLPLSGGTLTGAINLANNTWNKSGDDASFGDHNVGGKFCIKTQTSTATGIAFFNSSDTNVGQVEVNNAFTFNKEVKASSFQATSDRRKKSDIKEISDLNLSSIKSYNYILKDTNGRHTGLIAQEVQDVIPDAVKADEKGFLSLDYNAVVAVLVAKVNKLEARIKELENK